MLDSGNAVVSENFELGSCLRGHGVSNLKVLTDIQQRRDRGENLSTQMKKHRLLRGRITKGPSVRHVLGRFCSPHEPSLHLPHPSQEAGRQGLPERTPLLPAGDCSLGQSRTRLGCLFP